MSTAVRTYRGRPLGPNLQILHEERIGNGCLICDRPVPKPRGPARPRVICDDEFCQRMYYRAAWADSNWRKRQRKAKP